MKKLIFSVLGIVGMLCSTSCSDDSIVKDVEGDQTVQFTVALTDGSDASRAISDGQTVNKLYYEVYTNVNGTKELTAIDAVTDIENKQATVSLALVKGQTYDIVFWASKEGVYDTDDLTSITVNEGSTNDETKDAFTAVKRLTVNGPIKETVYLYRPFAQINFGTKDMAAAEAAGAKLSQSKIKVTYAADTYNALEEEGVGEGKTVEFTLGNIPNRVDEELVISATDSYEYLATAYVLFPGKVGDKVTTDLTLTVPTGLNKDVVIEVPAAPAQRNYRTNVLGNLLTNSAEFTVVVDNNFEGETNIDEKIPEGKFEVDGIHYNITSANTVEVTYKGEDAYESRNEYKGDITIPEIVNYKGNYFTVTKIGERAFYGSKINSIKMPNTITTFGASAFYSCYNITSISIPNSAKNIGHFMFKICTGLTTISIPDSVTEIGEYAFYNCSNLNTITLPNSITNIGITAFASCTSLTNINIPNELKEIKSHVFSYTSLTNIAIPNSVESIHQNAFTDCNLSSINVENGNNVYDSRDNCNAIIETATNTLILGCKNTKISNTVTHIGEHAFNGSDLTSITIPNTVISIGEDAFAGSALNSITIPNSISKISNGTFSRCTSLSNVIIPNSISHIGNYAFNGCTNLTEIEIPNSVTSIDYGAFGGCKNLVSITIPSNVISIGQHAFYQCVNLKEFIFNAKNCTEMGNHISPIFDECVSLTKLIIGEDVSTIPQYAFYGCKQLSEIICKSVTPPIMNNSFAFQELPATAVLYVPIGCKEAYLNADGWSSFSNIEETEITED